MILDITRYNLGSPYPTCCDSEKPPNRYTHDRDYVVGQYGNHRVRVRQEYELPANGNAPSQLKEGLTRRQPL